MDIYIVLWSLKFVLNCYINEYIGKYEVPLKHRAFMCILWMSLWQCVCRPQLVADDMCIEIRQGRHPVIQHLIGEGGQYVANDTDLQVSVCNTLLYVTPVSLRRVSTCPMIHIWVWVCYIYISTNKVKVKIKNTIWKIYDIKALQYTYEFICGYNFSHVMNRVLQRE